MRNGTARSSRPTCELGFCVYYLLVLVLAFFFFVCLLGRGCSLYTASWAGRTKGFVVHWGENKDKGEGKGGEQ